MKRLQRKAKNTLLGMDFVSPESEGLLLQRGGEEIHCTAEHSCTEHRVPPAKGGLREGSAISH